jgi:hypothetical protein
VIGISIVMRQCKLIARGFKNDLLTRFRRIIYGRKPGGNGEAPPVMPSGSSW